MINDGSSRLHKKYKELCSKLLKLLQCYDTISKILRKDFDYSIRGHPRDEVEART